MKAALRSHVVAALLLVPLGAALVAQPAAAQQQSRYAISDARLKSSGGLRPGDTLFLSAIVTAGAQDVTITLSPNVHVRLAEQSPGAYAGSYVVQPGDGIDPFRWMTVRAMWPDRGMAVRDYPFPGDFRVNAVPTRPPVAVPPVLVPPHQQPRPPHQQPPVATAPHIERFSVRPVERLTQGSVLRFSLSGQSRADASLDIPGVARGIDLREVRPGVYEGNYTVRRNDDLRAFETAVATLRRGPLRSTAQLNLRDEGVRPGYQAGRPGRDDGRPGAGRPGRDDGRPGAGRPAADTTPPQISGQTPRNGERVNERQRTHISARITDQGSGVDPSSVRLRVDGLDVTRNARIDGNEIRYMEQMGRGRHSAELVVRDKAGNTASSSWSFEVH